MKIIKNTSAFDTVKLKTLYSHIHREISKSEGKLRYWKTLKIQIWQKKHGYSGRAYLDKYYGVNYDMHLSMSEDLSLYNIAQLFAHELMHNYGYEHSQFRHHPLDEKQMAIITDKFTDADYFKKVDKPKQPINKVAKNYKQLQSRQANLLKKQKQYESNLKRIANSMKKIERKLKHYEKIYDEDRLTRKHDEYTPKQPKVKIDWYEEIKKLADRHQGLKVEQYEEYNEYNSLFFEKDVYIDGNHPDYWDYDKTGTYPCGRRYTWQQLYKLTVQELKDLDRYVEE